MQFPIPSRLIRWIGCAAAATLFTLSAQTASAQSVTNLVVAFPAGGPADFIARVLAEHLSEALDTRVIVENKPGGNGAIAASTVKRNKADGQTLWLTSVGAVAINPHLYSNMAYAPATDFVPVSTVVNSPEVFVVRADSPYTDAQAFIAAAKEGKGLTMASTGAGSVPHLALALLNEAAGVNIAHVPYRGAAPAVVDLIGGHVDGFIGDVPPLIPHIQSGKLRAIGASSEKRLPMYADLPTLAEQGLKDVHSDNWYALFVKAGTPDETVARINAALNTVLKKPAVIEAYQAAGLEVMGGSAQALQQLLQADTQRWGAVIQRAGIVAD